MWPKGAFGAVSPAADSDQVPMSVALRSPPRQNTTLEFAAPIKAFVTLNACGRTYTIYLFGGFSFCDEMEFMPGIGSVYQHEVLVHGIVFFVAAIQEGSCCRTH